MNKTLAKFIAVAAIALAPTAAHSFSQVRQVQISTNTLTRQTGTAVIAGVDVTTATVSTATITSAAITNLAVSSMTTTLPMSARKITGLADGTASTDAAAFGQVHFMQIPLFGSEATGGSTSSSSFIAFGSTITITPTSSASKIFVIGEAPCLVPTSTDGHTVALGIARNSVAIFSRNNSPGTMITGGTNSAHAVPIPIFYLDSPATTSATTYQLMLASGAGDTVTCGGATGTGLNSYIMAFEVK